MGTQECLSSQLDDLRRRLPEYGVVAAGRNDGRRSGETCAIFYRNDRFVQRDAGHFWLSDSPSDPGSKSWGAVWPRMTSWVRLAPRDGGAELFVFNSHFPVFSAGARDQAAQLLADQIRHIAGRAHVVITGDFNTDETSDAYRILSGSAKTGPWRDAYRFVHPQQKPDEATRHAYRGTITGSRIDWIFASRDMTPLDADILHDRPGGRFPSDHYPVTAVFSLHPTQTAIAPITAPRAPGAG
jgi:endonuclease/exonuclease/phosphatase family metal-dependent hydrolase